MIDNLRHVVALGGLALIFVCCLAAGVRFFRCWLKKRRKRAECRRQLEREYGLTLDPFTLKGIIEETQETTGGEQ